jgi:hypothetical protein
MPTMSRFAALALDTEAPRRMLIRHPATGETLRDADGTEAFIDLLALTSSAAQKARAEIQRRRIEGRVRRVTLEDAEREALQVLAACTKGWHLVTLTGDAMNEPCSADVALELYSEPGMRWLTEQATIFADNAGNYLPGSSKS